MTMLRIRGSLQLLCVVVLFAGCAGLSDPDCRDETRSLSTTARLTSTAAQPLASDTGTARISLHEGRVAATGATSYRDIMWFAGSGLTRNGVTAVHVHETGTDRLLFNVPLDPASGPPYVITQVFTRRPYTGAVSFTELYDLLGTERSYVDVHTANGATQLRGVLRPENANWQTFTHAFCS